MPLLEESCRPASLLVLLLAAVGASGCATVRAECPEHAGVAWRELRTEHFRIQTNMPSAEAREAAVELERFRRALGAAFSSALDPPGVAQVILLRDRLELREFAGPGTLGLTARSGTRMRFALSRFLHDAGPGLEAGALPTVQRHELAHFLMSYAFGRQPRWFAEGMAQYLQTATLLPDGASVRFGDIVAEAVLYGREASVLSLDVLWAWEGPQASQRREWHRYASAWAWVHYLMNQEPERFTEFMTGLARAQDPRQAWATAFAGVDLSVLERAVDAHVRNGRFYTRESPVSLGAVQVHERPMSSADVHVARATLHLMTLVVGEGARAKEAALRQELAEALRLEPDNVGAALLAAEVLPTAAERVAPLRALAEARPDDGPVWGAYAEALVAATQGEPPPEHDAVVQRAVALLPLDAGVQTALALHALRQARPAAALAASRRAIQVAPWHPPALDAHATALASLGRCAEAVAVYRRLLDVLPEGVPAEVRADGEAHVERVRRECRPAPEGAAGGEVP